MTALLATSGLGKRYGARGRCATALAVPEQSIVGIAGSNGAGKSTLLGLAVGLLDPVRAVAIAGRDPRRNAAALADIGYVARARTLYRGFASATCSISAHVANRRWDLACQALLLRSSPKTRVSALSGRAGATRARAGARQAPRAAAARRAAGAARPLASRDFLRLLMEGAAETGSAVVVATRVLGDIERICERVVLLAHGRCASTEREICSPPIACSPACGARASAESSRSCATFERSPADAARAPTAGRRSTWSVEQMGPSSSSPYMAPEELPSAAPEPSSSMA
jgi:ABC-2 type transport system ATP-binding protein